MFDAISAREIAVSGLKAQRQRINVIAVNIANMETTRTPKGGAFRRQMAILRARGLDDAGRAGGMAGGKAGVEVKGIVSDPSPLLRVYDPGHPDADAAGYVSYPNIHLSVEMVNLVSAQRAYDANVAVILSDKRMAQKALEIIQA